MTMLLLRAAMAAAQAMAPTIDHDNVLALRAPQTILGAAPAYAWSTADYAAEIDGARAMHMRPLDLLLVMDSESRLQPWADNGGIAAGLIQITPPAAKAMGMSEAERRALVSMSPAQQMPYVVRYFRAVAGNRSYADAGEVYQAVAAPGTFSRGSANDVVLYPTGSQAAQGNIGLDHNGDGAISMLDLRVHLALLSASSGYARATAELRGVDGMADGPIIGGGISASSLPPPVKPRSSGVSSTPGVPLAIGLASALLFEVVRRR